MKHPPPAITNTPTHYPRQYPPLTTQRQSPTLSSILPQPALHSFVAYRRQQQTNPNTMARAKQSGRILPHQRQTDDVTPIIAGDEITGDHAAAVHDTHSKGMKSKTRNEYRNRQSHIYKFWETEYPIYYKEGS